MLPAARVAEIRRLLEEGKQSRRQIAKTLGVARGTVLRVAHGEKVGRDPDARPRDQSEPLGPLGRCPECGGKVHLPCRLCRLRRRRGGRPYRRERDLPLGLELRDDHRRRYEQVVERRVQRGRRAALEEAIR